MLSGGALASSQGAPRLVWPLEHRRLPRNFRNGMLLSVVVCHRLSSSAAEGSRNDQENKPKTIRKWSKNHSQMVPKWTEMSSQGSRALSRSRGLPWAPLGVPGGPLGALWASSGGSLGPPWASLCAPWGSRERPSRRLGSIRSPPWRPQRRESGCGTNGVHNFMIAHFWSLGCPGASPGTLGTSLWPP